jgi:parallel beta-helix repeat protein
MTGINQGRPEMAIGEPIRLGSNNEFEIEQHPVSDRLIIRDTVNGKVAYVRKERDGQIGGDGVLVKALKEGKPVADDGRTHDTIQAAERAASGWVFIPPGTFNESVEITTEGLTLRGSGYNTLIDSSPSTTIIVSARNVTLQNFRATNTNDDISGSNNRVGLSGEGCTVLNVYIETSGDIGFAIGSDNCIVINCTVTDSDGEGIYTYNGEGCIFSGNIVKNSGNDSIKAIEPDTIIANNVVTESSSYSIQVQGNSIVIGNRVINSDDYGMRIRGDDNIVANNRISDSSNGGIRNQGTNTLLDGNLTGASN